jgi:hypothetical protein
MPVTWTGKRRLLTLALMCGIALVLSLAPVTGQTTTFNEREVKSEVVGLDDPNQDIWALDFRFKDPRLIKVNIPGRGTRICWYMWYQVINRTKEPRLFVPEFELVTHDFPGTYQDEILPAVQEAIKKLEDPTGFQDIKNSVTIASAPIPASKAAGEAFPRAVTGVAIWDGSTADEFGREEKKRDLSDSNRYSIFVTGLSNGWVLVDPIIGGKGEAPVVRRKTLQLNFERRGDRFKMDSREIGFKAPSEWIYRASQLRIPGQVPGGEPPAKGDGKKGADEKKGGEEKKGASLRRDPFHKLQPVSHPGIQR